MRFIVISDTHLGHPHSVLLEGSGDAIRTTTWYEKFKMIAQKRGTPKSGFHNKYLVLLGDTLDFSIKGYTKAFRAGRVFFNAVRKDRLAEEIIYVPGNHDFDIWRMVEYDANIRKRLEDGGEVRDFRYSIPGVIDDRKGAKDVLTLVGVKAKDTGNGGSRYGDLFLKDISIGPKGLNSEPAPRPLPFNVAYPNLYVVTDEGSVLLTHGQYFEMYWSLAGEMAVKIFRPDLGVAEIDTIRRLVALNAPLSQLACSGVGQAGELTDVIRKVVKKIRKKDLKTIKEYLANAGDELDRLADFRWFNPKEWCSDAVIGALKKGILRSLKDHRGSRFDTDYWFDPERKSVAERRKRFWQYLSLVRRETRSLLGDGHTVPMPETMIFGHTHQPIPWSDDSGLVPPIEGSSRRPFPAFNTGGWLRRPDDQGNEREEIAAEVFIYETGKGFSSVSVV